MQQDPGRVDHGAEQRPGALNNLSGPSGQAGRIHGRVLAVLKTHAGLANRGTHAADHRFPPAEPSYDGKLVMLQHGIDWRQLPPGCRADLTVTTGCFHPTQSLAWEVDHDGPDSTRKPACSK